MKVKNLKDKSDLISWLSAASAIAVSVIVCIEDVQQIEITANSYRVLSSAIEKQSDKFPEGPYLVKYEDIEEDKNNPDLDYTNLVMVIAMEALSANDGKKIGGLSLLIRNLSDFEFCCATQRKDSAHTIAGIWVAAPKEPDNLVKLNEILSKYAMAYAFHDGTGEISFNNFRFNRSGIDVYPELDV